MKTIALPQHKGTGEYCAVALIKRSCPENHDYTLPVQVPTGHSEIVSALRDHLFLARVGQVTPQQFLDNVAELDKRYLQIGQYLQGQDVEQGASQIVAVV